MAHQTLEDFRKTRQRTLSLVDELDQEQVDFAPAPDKWSVSEVLDHLTRTDRVFRDELRELVRRGAKSTPVFLIRGLSDFDFSLPFVPQRLIPLFDLPLFFFSVVVPRPIRQAIARNRAVPAQSPKIIRPEKGRTAQDLRHELAEYGDWVEKLLADHPDLPLEKLYYYNPLTAFTNLPGLLSFTASHESRHQEQLQDIFDSPGFPAA